jgi:Xaa-Pro aminopeptidase
VDTCVSIEALVTEPAADHPDRLAALRADLAARGLDGFLVPRGDAFLGEYVPPSAERLAWLTGFTGSAGLAIVLADQAFLFADGRYTAQAQSETDGALWTLRHLIEQPPADTLRAEASGRRIGYDPWLHAEAAIEKLAATGAVLVPLEDNPIDALWTDRPAPPAGPAVPHPIGFAGLDSAAKRESAAGALRAAGEDAAVLADPHSVAWLLNMRGGDLGFTPLALAQAVLLADGRVDLFLDPARVDGELRDHLGNAVAVRPAGEFGAALDALAGKAVRLDADATPAWIARRLRAAEARIVAGDDPCRLPRALKNVTEQDGARAAHRRDGLAVSRFLAWFAQAPRDGALTEMAAAAKLLALRAQGEHFVSESFPAIAGAGEHGAIIHYRVSPETNRAIRANEVFLIDSGAQYRDGTTDVTRTLWTGPNDAPEAIRERYTRVLQGHLALAATRFPEGVAGPHLDAIARRALWDVSLDYDHGTGHGIGSFLSVHEGPAGISRNAKPVPLKAGMILSNEPGYYEPGAYGIRIENLLLVCEAEAREGARKTFFGFEVLTLAPYERALIEVSLLSPAEIAQLDEYHARVLRELWPRADTMTRLWLRKACAAVG